jgi:hypothetical protein
VRGLPWRVYSGGENGLERQRAADPLLSFAAVDEQGRRPFAAGEVERAALFAVETRGLPGVKHKANARRRARAQAFLVLFCMTREGAP